MIAEIAEGANVPLVNLFTDNDGRFVFRNLAPGQYMVRAKRDGFVGAIPGIAGGFPTLVTTPVSVVAGSTTPEVSIKLLQGRTISGRVRDTSGQAAANLTVAAFQVGYRDGQASLNSVSSRLADDRGEYRIIFLPPGSYYVAVTQARQGAGAPILVPPLRLPDAGGTRTFFPGVLDARSAQLLAVTGGDISGIDISIRTVAKFQIAGRIVSTLPVPNGQTRSASATLYLLSRDPGQVTDGLLASIRTTRQTLGSLKYVGSCRDLTIWWRLTHSTGRTYPGRVRVEVGSQDLEGVTVSIHPGVAVKARVFVDGKFTPAPPSAPAVLPDLSLSEWRRRLRRLPHHGLLRLQFS